MADRNEAGESAAVYVAWGTMRNAIERLSQGVPTRIDRTVFQGYSGGTQSQLLAGLKFLGLIDEEGKPTPVLHALAVPDEDARKKKLEAILRDRYADLFGLDLMKTTPALLEEKMGESYNVSGSTRDKAMRFFLAAVEYAGIPVSPLFERKPGNGGAVTRRRRGPVGRPRGEEPSQPTPPSSPPGPPGTARTVALKSGGTLTVSASLDIFSLDAADRTFVFELIDRLTQYEKAGG